MAPPIPAAMLNAHYKAARCIKPCATTPDGSPCKSVEYLPE
jgi:hypothetical protein